MKQLEKYKLITQKYYGLFYHLDSFGLNAFENWYGLTIDRQPTLKSVRTGRIVLSEHNFNYTGVVTLVSSLETILDGFLPYMNSTEKVAICEYQVDEDYFINESSFKVWLFDKNASRWDMIRDIRGRVV